MTNVDSGGASNVPHNHSERNVNSPVNEDTVIVRHSFIDAVVLSVEDDAGTLIELRGYVHHRVASWHKSTFHSCVDDAECQQSRFLLVCNKSLFHQLVVFIRHRATNIVSRGRTAWYKGARSARSVQRENGNVTRHVIDRENRRAARVVSRGPAVRLGYCTYRGDRCSYCLPADAKNEAEDFYNYDKVVVTTLCRWRLHSRFVTYIAGTQVRSPSSSMTVWRHISMLFVSGHVVQGRLCGSGAR